MGKVISTGKLTQLIKSLKRTGNKIVLVGGCFDVLHPGHVIFLEKAKRLGDSLIVLLESDEKVKILKGHNRPVNLQRERAQVLAALASVDYILMLPFLKNDMDYDELIAKVKPDIVAATKGSANSHHQRSAKKVGAKLKYVTKMIGDYSTSRILHH